MASNTKASENRGGSDGKLALVICPSSPADEPDAGPLLGLTVRDRLLHALARAGVSQAAFVGPGRRPTSERAEVKIIPQEQAGSFEPRGGFFLLPADLVFDPNLLDDPKSMDADLPLRWLPPSEWGPVTRDPAGWLDRLGQGSADVGPGFALRVNDRESRRTARRALLNSLRKPIDGIVSRHINRPVSLFVTRFLVRTPFRPNQLTVFFTAIGIAAAVLVALAQPWWMLVLAALLLQAQSILDGCDGEIARLTYRFSLSGQWLDTIGDDLTNYLFCLGLAVGQARVADLPWLYAAGGVTFLFQCLTSAIGYRRLIQMGTGDWLATPDTLTKGQVKGAWGKVLGVLGVIRQRDVLVFTVAVLTAAQLPLVVFFLCAAGTYASFAGILVNDIRIGKLQRQAQSTGSE